MKATFTRNITKKLSHKAPVHIITKQTGQGGIEVNLEWYSVKEKEKSCKGEVVKENSKTIWVHILDAETNELVTIKRHKERHNVVLV